MVRTHREYYTSSRIMINTKGVTYGGYVAPFVLYLINHWSVIVTLVIDKITSCHHSYPCWHLVSCLFST